MCTIKRLIVLICTTALCVCLFANAKAKADSFPSASEILDIMYTNVDLTSIAEVYTSLNLEQKMIANYIIGAFNNVYLCARGFSYSIPDDESSYKAQFLAMGETVWQYATTAYGWKSRFNEVFRQYLSSVLVYVSGINQSFDAWYNGVKYGGDSQLYIPYSEDSFSAWTTFYNDPSGDGIASFGSSVSDWDSGTFYDFAFTGIAWDSTSVQSTYNNFILNNSPVMYTNYYNNSHGDLYPAQVVFSPYLNGKIIDTLYILRGSSGVQYYAWGYSDFTLASSGNLNQLMIIKSSNKLRILWEGSQHLTPFVGTQNSGTLYTNIGDLIAYAFNRTPFNDGTGDHWRFNGYYTFVQHVVLVDNLTTLSNPTEIYNTDDLNIVAPNNDKLIIAPNGRMILPLWPYANDDPMGFWDIIEDNSYDTETELPASDDNYHTSIVNNTTINNYYVSDDTKINVPANWFDNENTDILAQDSTPFLQFAHDCISTLGDLQLYIYGAIVIGLAGGIVKKLLL